MHALRLWVTGEGKSSVVRPRCCLVISLYPDARLLSFFTTVRQAITDVDILSKLCDTFLHPTFGSQRRPRTVTGAHGLSAGVTSALLALGVETGCLSEAPGTEDHAREVASMLRGGPEPDTSSSPDFFPRGARTSAGLWQELCRAGREVVFGSAATHSAHNYVPPWLNVPPHSTARHLVVKVTATKTATIGNGKRGHVHIEAGDSVWLGLLHDDDGVLGIALFWSRLDCEARMKPPTETLASVHRAPVAQCSFAAHVRRTGLRQDCEPAPLKTKLKSLKPRRYDSRDGQELLYASREAMKRHWPLVKVFARPLADRDASIAKNEKWWWPGGEAIMLYRSVTELSFDDVEHLDALDIKLPTSAADEGIMKQLGRNRDQLLPVPMALKVNQFSACTAEQLAWLIIGCKVCHHLAEHSLMRSCGSSNEGVNDSFDVQLDDDSSDDAGASASCPVGVTVSSEPVLLRSEVDS